jgi:uncharacterized UBP type Zn finger protein
MIDLEAEPKSKGCEACAAAGVAWKELRICLTCGAVGCSDDSPGQHALAHFQATGHPIICSFEEGQSWRWCYLDETYLDWE